MEPWRCYSRRLLPAQARVEGEIRFSGQNLLAASETEMRSVRANWSMLRLPEQPMMPRLFDRRVGWFSTPVIDYGRPDHETVTRRYIHRFRLEKHEPAAVVAEPLQQLDACPHETVMRCRVASRWSCPW